MGCFLPTLDNDLVTGWLDENDVSWKDTSLNLDVVFIFGLSLDSFLYLVFDIVFIFGLIVWIVIGDPLWSVGFRCNAFKTSRVIKVTSRLNNI